MAAPTTMAAGQRPSTERHRMLDRRKSITFKEKLFYLDLPHTKHTQLLTKAICRLGGVIEGFLSRDVNYVVTGSRKALEIANGSSVAGRRGGHCKRQAAENIEPALCRGKQLLKKAIQNQEHSSVLANAHSWGVCILHVDEVLEYLKHSKNSAFKTAEGNGAGKTVKVGKLKCPFLKIEDQSRKYRPLQCCFSNFPEISFISSDRSPFETARTNNSTHKEKDAGDQEDDGERSQRPHAREKSGYCECCQVAYTKLSEHLISERHGQFALDPSNYKVIDDIACHILCDLMGYPHGIMPVLERGVGDGSVSAEDAWNCVVKEESKIGMPEQPCQENGAVIPVEENNTVHNVGEEHMPLVAHTQPVNNFATGEQEEDMDVTMHDGGPVEDKGQRHPFVEDADDLIQCNEPLQEICDTGAASHVDVVTEVSWYTEEAGLTSVYTVQSLVIPPHGQHAQLTMANTLATFTSPLLLSPLADLQGAQGTERLSEVHNEPGLEDPLPVAQMTNTTGAHCSELLVKQTSLLEVHEQHQELFAEPSTGNLSEVQLLDALVQLSAGERRSEEMLEVQLGSIRLQEQLMLSGDQNESLLNASSRLHKQVDITLSPDQLNVIPLYDGPADTLVLTPGPTLLTNHSDREDRNQLNVIPLAQGFADIAAVTQGATSLGNEDGAPEQNQLKVIPLCQGPADTAEVAQGTTPLGNETSALQQNQLNVIPLCQDTAEVAQGTTPLGNEASALQQNRLNVIPLFQDPAEVAQGTTPLGNEASALQQNRLNVMPLCQDPAEVAQGTTPLGNEASALQQNRLNVITLCQDPAVTHSTRTMDKKASTPEQNQLQSTTLVCRGKRRHSWSSSPPTAKRQPCQYQPLPLPVYVFHQLPDSRLQPAAHGFPDLMNRAEGTGNTPSPSFSPKLIQYDASSEPDWDLGLLSQQQCKHQQAAHLGDLRTAQVNLDESWYGRQLCSVLAEDQNLGSSSTTQTVTLAHTSYDLYLSEVAS